MDDSHLYSYHKMENEMKWKEVKSTEIFRRITFLIYPGNTFESIKYSALKEDVNILFSF